VSLGAKRRAFVVALMEVRSMSKVTRNPLPAPLRPEDVGQESGVLKVKDVLVDVPSDKNRRGKVTVILTWGHEGKGMYLNAASIDAAIQGFKSDESDQWKDQDFPFITVRTEYVDKDSQKKVYGKTLWVAPPEQWAGMLKEHRARKRDAKAK